MGGGIENCGEPLVLIGRPGLYDTLLVRVNRGHGFIIGLTEIPEAYTSLYPIVDFVVDDALSPYISFLEKIVIGDVYRVPPMAFAVIGFYNSYGDKYVEEALAGLFDSSIRLWTVQWFGWDVKPKPIGDCSLYDFIMSYSTYLPSSYRPELLNGKYRYRPGRIRIFNYYAFNDQVSVGDLRRYFVSGGDDVDYVVFPPNLLNISKFTDVSMIYGAFNFDYHRFGDYFTGDGFSGSCRYVLELYRDLFGFLDGKECSVFPYFCSSGNRLSIFYIVFDGRWRVVDSPVFEGDSFVIDPFNIYRGSKTKIFFGLWRRVLHRKGFTIVVYLNFSGYKMALSRMFYEARYGGKIIYSSPSRLGLL